MIPLALAFKTAAVVAGAAGLGITAVAAASSGGTPVQTVAARSSTHQVIAIKHGDTLGGLAARYCGTASAYPSLALANHLADPDRIIAGKQITIVCTGAPPARIHPRPEVTVTVTVTAPAPAKTVTVPPSPPPDTRSAPVPTPTKTPQQALVPASTPTPTHSAKPKATQPAPARTPAPSSTCVAAAPGSPIIPGTYISVYSRCGLEQLWIQAGGSRAQAARAACMALAVSGGRTFATSSHGSMGLWQIPSKPSGYATFQPAANARAAVLLSKNGTKWYWISGTADC